MNYFNIECCDALHLLKCFAVILFIYSVFFIALLVLICFNPRYLTNASFAYIITIIIYLVTNPLIWHYRDHIMLDEKKDGCCIRFCKFSLAGMVLCNINVFRFLDWGRETRIDFTEEEKGKISRICEIDEFTKEIEETFTYMGKTISEKITNESET